MARRFLFECDFELGNETKHLKVYRDSHYVPEVYTIYTCCFDVDEDGDEVSVDILKENGVWYDADGGLTNLSEMLGKILDANIATEQPF